MNPPLVMKFGGASFESPHSFKSVAQFIRVCFEQEKSLVIVVSAMKHTTDSLFSLAHEVNANPPHRELDMLVSAGERMSIALLAMALHAEHLPAMSFTGSQSGILTTNDHSNAKIVSVRPRRIWETLEKEVIAVVAGFQGMSTSGEITTLGRGGSDTTAVALAAALGAPRVDFYKDVGGIFSTDPKTDSEAKLISNLSYQEAYQLVVQGGARILHPRSIALAEKNGIPLHVVPGTIVGSGSIRNKTPLFEQDPLIGSVKGDSFS